MASKRALASIPQIARLASPAPARALSSFTLLRSRPRRHLPSSLASTTTRLAHSIPRPRNGSPFNQEKQHKPTTTSSGLSPETPSQATRLAQQPDATTTTNNNSNPPQTPSTRDIRQQPHYELTFTCRPCDTRSRHRVSKHGYHHGTVLITCPQCKNRHVISDHLRIFGDAAATVEDILRQRGELVKKGTLGGGDEEGDLEFWDDGTTTEREPWVEVERPKSNDEDLPPGATFKSVKPGDKKAEE